MILPASYLSSLLLLILSMLCWGSWANTFKAAGKWRFELFYFDYAIGVFIASIVCAFTFGTMGIDGFSVMDDLSLAGKKQELLALIAGMVFNLANMLIVGAISIAGMAVAFPVGIGLALVVGVVLSYVTHPVGNIALLGCGCIAILGAIVLDSVAWRQYVAQKTAPAAKEAAVAREGSRVAPKTAKKTSAGSKGVWLAIIGGVLMGLFYPIVELSKQGENGLGPYTIGLIFATGVLLSTFVYNLFFMNLPIQGEPLEFTEYFHGNTRHHLLGLAGGVLWFIGAITNFVAARAEGPALVGPAVSYAMGQGATLITVLWGLIVWKEFAGAQSSVRTLVTAMLALFVIGLAAVSLAPIYGAH
jgi:glucose uptake protein